MMQTNGGLYWRMITLKRRLSKNKYTSHIMRFINIFIRTPIVYIEAIFTLVKIIRRKKDDEIYLLPSWTIGETVYGMAYIGELLEKFDGKKIIVIGNGALEKLYKTYAARDTRIILRLQPVEDEPKWRHLIRGWRLPETARAFGIFIAYPASWQFYKNTSNPEILYSLRKIFGLPEDAAITYHGLQPGTVKAIPDFEANKHRIVVINPYSGSMKSTIGIYEKFCEELNTRGYTVYTNARNAVGKLEVLKGSRALECDIYEFYSIACNIPLIVSVRSGILDLSAASDVNMFVMNENIEGVIEACDLTAWKRKGRIKNVFSYTNTKIDSEIFSEFSAFLDELKQEGRIS